LQHILSWKKIGDMIPKTISSADDLVTTHEATCLGFLEQAKVKAEKAAIYIDCTF
jgi:hypothetical protein